MSIGELTKGIYDCDCKKPHVCPLEAVVIEKDALRRVPELCAKYTGILVVADKNTWEVCGEKVFSLLPRDTGRIILDGGSGVVIPDESVIAEIEAAITPDTGLLLGVGSGVINDLCKHVSFRHGLPYFIVATAPSMDGYVSVGAALILGGMKITVNARPPKAVIADTDVLRNAPLSMLQSGYGDIVGKYSCLNDWKLSALINGEYFCRRVYDIVYGETERIKPLGERIKKRDKAAVGALMEALVVVGIAMSYVGTSRPASGSEHHLSHFFEITGILENKPYFPHGIDVLYSSVLTARIREEIITSVPEKRVFDRALWEQEIRRVYRSSAEGVIALQDRLGQYKKDDGKAVYGNLGEIQALLKEAPSSGETEALAKSVGLDCSGFTDMYGQQKLRDATLYAKDLKDRYSVLWLYYSYYRK